MSDAMRFDQLIVKLLCCALEASAAYNQAIEEAQNAGLEDVVAFLGRAKRQDEERAQQAMEIIQSFFNQDFW